MVERGVLCGAGSFDNVSICASIEIHSERSTLTSCRSVMRMIAEQALPSPADPFYYATLQTHRLAKMRWAGAPFPMRMMRWALRWFVEERELVDMLVRKGMVSSAVGVGRARGRLGVPV